MRYSPGDVAPTRPTYTTAQIEAIVERIRKLKESCIIYLESSTTVPYDIDTLYDTGTIASDGIYMVNVIKETCLPDVIKAVYFSSYLVYPYTEGTTQYQILRAGKQLYIRYLIPSENSTTRVWSIWTIITTPTSQIIDESTNETLDVIISKTLISVDTIALRDKIPYSSKANGRLVRVANTDIKDGTPSYYYWDKANSVWVKEAGLEGETTVKTIYDVPGLSDSIIFK